MAGLKAFRESYVSADLLDESEFGDFDARKMRYAIYWSFFENTAYRNIHKWAVKVKADYGLYKYTRNIYNPTYRLGEFYKTHLIGGALDLEAGDGKTTPSALPIDTDSDALRSAIAMLWRASNWQINKGKLGLWGPILGDVALKVVDDPVREKVYLDVVHPGTIKSVEMDPFGNVKGYVIEEERADPIRPDNKQKVIYTERATREGDDVVYETLLDGKAYAWDGQSAAWQEPYGFVPLVMCRHNDVGLTWGWSELHPGVSKIREADDVASKLSDQVRKMVDAPWLFAGVSEPSKVVSARGRGQSPTTNAPEPGREEVPVLYTDKENAKAIPIVAPLDIAATAGHIKDILAEIEREYPELQMDIWNAGGDTSGRALRLARQRVTSKVMERRPNYDNAIVRAQQMAIAIGGFRSYEGYEGFDLDSFNKGELDHSIAARPVFQVDSFEKIEEENAFWGAADVARRAGVPLNVYLKLQNWTDDKIELITGSPEYQNRQALMETGLNAMKTGQGETNSAPPQRLPKPALPPTEAK